ncbi:MAG: ABC transporter ATP-binding protein, partial [Caulobacteraceae bacterium]
AGTIAFAGAEADEARREDLHLLGHYDGLKSWRKAGDELAFAAAWAGAAPGGRERAVATLELAPLLDLEVRVLSAGQRRRLALARLIAAPRALWLLDEPMAPLDAGWRTRLARLMSDHLARGGMILAAVHDPLPIPARAVEIAPC